jgi:uncharacterized YigZ family protein
MYRINEEYENKIIINKSIFITHLYRVNNVDEVNDILASTRKKYYDATHNCYAYIIGDNGDIKKASDDGEPSKTAGFPMLDVLEKNNLTNILAITTRYFGGILLGTGGLVRAYSSSVSECLKQVKLYDTKPQIKFSLTLSYSGYNTLIKTINYINIIDTSFNQDIIIIGSIDKELYDKLNEDLYKYKIDSKLTYLEDTQIEVLIK